jgi:hypothetical protein
MTEEALEGEALARDVVAHSIEERMNPDSHMNGGGPAFDGSAGQGPAAGMPSASQQPGMPAAGAAVHPGSPMTQATEEVFAPAASDDWKSYEVKESKQDWSSYEVPRQEAPAAAQPAQPAPQQTKKPVMEKAPNDIEVEEALSGLTEMAFAQPKEAVPKAAQPATTPAAPRTATPPAQAAPVQAAQPAAPRTATPPAQAAPVQAAEENGEDSNESQKWSMEELRKNLSNIDNRDS